MNEKLDLSVVIIAYNEEKNLADCIASCSFAGEIVVVDDFSTDSTLQIAKSLGARVSQRALNGDWGSQQTYAIRQASRGWLLLIDADERVSPELAREIIGAVTEGSKYSYLIRRENRFRHFKITHGPLRRDWVTRLMPNEGVTVEGLVHQKIITRYPLKKLRGLMYHYTYRDWDQYYGKMSTYACVSANKYAEKNKSVCFLRDIVLRPLWAFFKVYVLNLGFVDGKIGFIFAVNHYAYTFQKYVRYYTLRKTGGEL